MIRQGDVLLVRVPSAPKAGAPQEPENGRQILARGEATGHHHSVDAGCATIVRTQEVSHLIVREICALEHQEHAPIALAPGSYRIVHQREYHPVEVRRVAD